jgi:glycosyltransferase involved in cell wall biosynthesis
MKEKQQPLVTVLTPVYNGDKYLAECIESVLNQTYQNFEYIVVNNCSKDATLAVAQEYAKKDKRVRIHDNTDFVPVIANHNIAFNLMSSEAKYCKMVSGDDFIFPTCIEKMVEFAEANPTAGFINCYQLSGDHILWQGLKYPNGLISGIEICRRVFLGGEKTFGFGSPTSLMYRADLVRDSKEFYPNPSPHSDTSACFRYLHQSNFGFVYEVLSYERTHEETQSHTSGEMNRYSSASLNDIIEYGPHYLHQTELKEKIDETLKDYHRFLVVNYFVGFRGKDFWNYHEGRLKELGYPLKRTDLVKAGIVKAFKEVSNPAQGIKKVLRCFRRKQARVARKITKSGSGDYKTMAKC